MTGMSVWMTRGTSTTVDSGRDVDARDNGKTMGSEPAPALSIETAGLVKRYGSVVALDNVDLAVPRAAVGLLGPNGAGKSTLLKILLGLSRPNGGKARVLGRDAVVDGRELRMRVGYMPETDTLPDNATAADFVSHMAEMSGLPRRAARQRAADVLYQVGLDEERYRLVKGFSTGMKQRVKLAQAIVHDPELVFLDEPTNGLDPLGREEMLDLIGRINRQLGILVVLSSHILDDVERVCDYVVVLDGGHVGRIPAAACGGRRDGRSARPRRRRPRSISEASRGTGSGLQTGRDRVRVGRVHRRP